MFSFKYVVGFLFSPDLKKVVLIKKNSPEWQRGLLNGVGGKIEPSEEPLDAMEREFHEETGVNSAESNIWWLDVARVKESENWSMVVYAARAHSEEVFNSVKTTTQEEVAIYNSHELPPNVISNLTWLIPLSMDIFMGDRIICADFEYL